MTAKLDAFARRFANLERQVKNLGSVPQLAYSSIDAGALKVKTFEGAVRQQIGLQFDGTYTVAALTGPPPPTPTTPTASPELNAAKVNWDGLWADGAIVPMDFSRVEIHASLDPTDTAQTAVTLVGTYETPRGGDIYVPLAAGLNYIRLVARSQSGARSAASAAVTVTPTTVDDITFTVTGIANDAAAQAQAAQDAADQAQITADGKNAVHYGSTAPTGGVYVDGDIWFDESNGNRVNAWDAGTGTWVIRQDTAIIAAHDLAAAAQTAAATAQATADGAIRTYYQADAPTGLNNTTDVGDMWFDSDNNQANRWNGTAWILIEDNSIAAALAAANNAQLTADGKNKVTYSAADPGVTANKAGDVWFTMVGGVVSKQWQGTGGTSWAQVTLGDTVIANLDAGKITSGSIAAARIAAGTITSTMMVTGTITAASGIIADAAITDAKIANLDAAKITTGTLDANRISANSIDVSKLTVASLDNLVADPAFARALGSSWESPAWASIATTASRAGGRALQIANNATKQTINNLPLDATRVISGDSYRLTLSYKADVAVPQGGVEVGVRVKNTDGSFTYLAIPNSAAVAANTWATISGVVTIPTTASTMTPYIDTVAAFSTGNVTVDGVGVTRAADASLIVDGSIKATHIATGAVDATKIKAGTLEAGFTLTGSLQVGTITIQPGSGIVIPQPDGGVIRFPADGTAAKVTADIVATSMSIKDSLTIAGTGQVTGNLSLANGISAPKVAPTVSYSWPSMDGLGDGTQDLSGFNHGLDSHHSDATKYVMVGTFLGGSAIHVLNKSDGKDTGTNIGAGQAWQNDFRAYGGICRIGSYYYICGTQQSTDNVYIYRIDASSGAIASQIYLGHGNIFNGLRPRLMADTSGGIVYLIWCNAYNQLTFRGYYSDLHAAATGDGAFIANMGGQFSVADAHYGDIGDGVVRAYVAVQGSATYSKIMAFTLAPSGDSTRDFPPANNSTYSGFTFDSAQGRFVAYDTTGVFWTHSKLTASTVSASYTFYDGDNSNYPAGTIINGTNVGGTASGTHETTPSPTTTVTVAKRSWPTVEASPAPDEGVTDSTRVDKADRIGMYIAADGGTQRRYNYLAKGVRVISNFDTMPSTGAVPTTNGFSAAAAAPGTLKSSATDAGGALITLSGDGSWRLGGIKSSGASLTEVQATGKLTTADVLVTGVLTFTGDIAWTDVAYAGYYVGYGAGQRAPRYRKVNGWVELRGLVKMANAGSTTITVLPSGCRPAEIELFPCPISPSGTTFANGTIQVATDGTVTIASGGVSVGGWVSLAGIRFQADGS